MKLEEGKVYRTKAGRKVGPMRKEGLIWDQVGCLQVWHGDGRVMTEIGDESHDYIVAEWEDEYKTLREFDVKPGDDTPKPFKDLTDAEIGALVRAEREGKTIEWLDPSDPEDTWDNFCLDLWVDHMAYRVRPEPKWETATVHYSGGAQFTKLREAHTTRRITLPLTHGRVPAGVYLNADSRAIVVEELE